MSKWAVKAACWLCLALAPVAIAGQTPADQAAPSVAVDEFGVPVGDTPPPIPPGYESTDAAMQAIMGGKVPFFMPGMPVPLPEGVVEHKDVEYGKGGDKSLLLDLYMPEKLDQPVPGLIFIHGGGWEQGNRNDYRYYTVRYAKRGYVVATITYRLSHEATYPAAVQDAKCAVRWMRANAAKYHVDPDRIAVLGGSAGGYLSMMVGYTSDVPALEGDGGHGEHSSRVQAVVDIYGPTDLDVPEARDAGAVKKFLPQAYEGKPELFKEASPLTHLTKDDPPTLVIHGTVDDLVPIWQSDVLVEKLKELDIPVVYEKYEGWPHTMDVALDVNRRIQWAINQFLKKHLGELP